MTDAETAFATATRMIEEARETGAVKFDFDTPETHALDRLPAGIGDLTKLEYLVLNNTQVTDLSPLTALPGRFSLYLNNTQITDLSPLSALTGLSRLYLHNTPVTDLSPLSALTGLSLLSLSNTQVTDLSPLTTLAGLSWLYLDSTQVTDLSPLTTLTGLSWLSLDNTQITDLSPLTALTGLSALSLVSTQVTDLRPLRNLSLLAEKPKYSGLTFTNTPATRSDPRIAEIAEIEDDATRARELFAYLEDWVPPGDVTPPPRPDPLFETVLINGQLELAPDPPTQAERDEALKRVLHQRLQSAAPDLARAAGNQFPRLANKARVLASLVDVPFSDLDLLAIHLEVETLHDRLERGTEDGVAFPDDVLGPLSDVTRAGPGLTLGHPTVDLLVQRVRDARSTPPPAEEELLHRALSDAIVADADANGPNSRAMEARVAALEDAAQQTAGWRAKHKWVVWILSSMGHLSNAITLGGAVLSLVGAFGGPVGTFISTNAALLWDVALTYGPGFSNWFAAVMIPVYAELGVAREVIQRMRSRR